MSTKRINYLNEYVSEKINYYIERNDLAKRIFYKVIDNYDDVTFIDITFNDKTGYNLYYVRDDNHLCCVVSDNPIVTNFKVLDIGNYQMGIDKRHIKYVQFKEKCYRVLYENIDNGNKYEIWLFMNNNEDISEIIDEILDENRNISSISDIVYAIRNVVPLNEIYLDVNDLNNNGKISCYAGNLGHYEEYSIIGNCTIKTYLEDGKFYIEEINKKELPKDRIPFVKKLGGKYE